MNTQKRTFAWLLVVALMLVALPQSALAFTLHIPSISNSDATVEATASVEPVFVEGNPSCKSLGYDFGFKPSVGGNEGFIGEYTFDIPDAPGKTVTVTSDGTYVDWESTLGFDAVIVKGGPNANLYKYDPPATSDGGLSAPINNNDPFGMSHVEFCWNAAVAFEELAVTKTAVTSYEREHNWGIAKKVETENKYMLDGFPKIWLDGPGSEGDETATWTVDVTYEGYEDSDWNVAGVITIKNVGTLPAVIESVVDMLDDTSIPVDCGGALIPGHILPVDATLTCSYSQDVDSKIDGMNVATVTTERDTYSGSKAIEWGAPTTELYATVNVKDISDLFGEVDLGTVTAPNNGQFPYTKDFAWEDYKDSCGAGFAYKNTAAIVETKQSAVATLKVNVRCEELTVTKTAVTSYEREHNWGIAKKVETENKYMLDGFPKVWLYIDGSGDEMATWTVDVTYMGFEDSGFNVAGDITIENTGDLPAVITSIVDELAGDEIDIVCDGDYDLAVGETLVCAYNEDGYVEGENVVTVTTERDTYSATEPIIWGDPTTELYAAVNVKDISDLFGEVDLGTVTAPNNGQFPYDKAFAWADYGADGCGDFVYNNTAMIVETGQSASATLKVNVQCYVYETAFAKGVDATCFIDDGFSRWGWTNPIVAGNDYTMDLWAAAGQCDTDKGTLVGSVGVVHAADGYVTVTYNVASGFLLDETHVYAGTTKYPMVKQGKTTVPTVAPGQYYNASPFDAGWVIAHAVVGIPDPDFGP